MAKLLLSRLGATDIRIADDGSAAVEAVAKSRPDLILMDVQMPGMDGFQATEAIRNAEARAGLSRLPIIALTANAMTGDRERCLAAGMDEYVSKPLRAAALTTAVRDCLHACAMTTSAKGSANSKAQGNETPMINPESLNELRELAAEDCPSLYRDAVIDIETRMQAMRAAYAEGDCGSMGKQAHAIKGACASLGLDPLAEVAGLIEEAARANQMPNLDALEACATSTKSAIYGHFPTA